MSVSIEPSGSGGRKSLDVDINLVPFIDMMSCLVAFLLFTAVWTNLAQIKVKPKGLSPSAESYAPPDRQNLSMLVAADAVWIASTTGERHKIARIGDSYDWDGVGQVLTELHEGAFAGRDDLEIAGEDGAQYQAIIAAMDVAVAHGFSDVGYVDPRSLTAPIRE
jgi:biopolymer transport protein ExbD